MAGNTGIVPGILSPPALSPTQFTPATIGFEKFPFIDIRKLKPRPSSYVLFSGTADAQYTFDANGVATPTGTDNAAAVRTQLAAAQAAGKMLVIPRGRYRLIIQTEADAIKPASDAYILWEEGAEFHWGMESWKYYNTTGGGSFAPYPCMAVINADDVYLDHPQFVYTGVYNGGVTGPINGPGTVTRFGAPVADHSYAFNTNVCVFGSHRFTCESLRHTPAGAGNEILTGLHIGPKSATAPAQGTRITGHLDGVSVGVTLWGQDQFDVSLATTRRGRAWFQHLNNPGHLIYVAKEAVGNTNGYIHDCYDSGDYLPSYTTVAGTVAYPAQYSSGQFMLQLKNVTGLRVERCTTSRPEGLCGILNVSNAQFSDLSWRNRYDTSADTVGVIHNAVTATTERNSNVSFERIRLQSDASQLRAAILIGSGGALNTSDHWRIKDTVISLNLTSWSDSSRTNLFDDRSYGSSYDIDYELQGYAQWVYAYRNAINGVTGNNFRCDIRGNTSAVRIAGGAPGAYGTTIGQCTLNGVNVTPALS